MASNSLCRLACRSVTDCRATQRQTALVQIGQALGREGRGDGRARSLLAGADQFDDRHECVFPLPAIVNLDFDVIGKR